MTGQLLFSAEKIKSLIEINTKLNSNYAEPDKVLVYILESAMCLVECESSSILLLNREGSALHFAVALGPKGAEAKDVPVDTNSIAGWVIANNQSVIVDDVPADTRFNRGVQDKTNYITKNMIATPIRIGNDCIGVIELINKVDGKKFTEDDVSILELVGIQAGNAYRNSHFYINTRESIDALQDSVSQGKDFHAFIAKSPIILDTIKVIEEASKVNSSVLILGESGVGKELFAEQMHLKSPRREKPFVRVSCAALSPSILESELFGHVKGAYTNAINAQKGRFEVADGGTLFLDEIGEMPLELQAKLLRVIQERKFEKVGSSETVSVDVRIIAATNRDLESMIQAGKFRADLYYRLNVLPLNIPPLRQRKDDIEPLAYFFLQKYSSETKKPFVDFSTPAIKALYSYPWPGNVRELENTIERACILGTPPHINLEDFRLNVSFPQAQSHEPDCMQNCVLESLSAEDKSLKNAVNEFKKRYVKAILEQNDWNQTKSAKVLGIQRTYVSKLLAELEIKKQM